MRTGSSSALALVLTLCLATLLSSPAFAKRRALIIGINQYVTEGVQPVPRGSPPDSRHWRSLSGAVNDAIRMQEVLLGRFGFDRKSIRVLLDQEAERDAILGAIDDLVATSARGDVVLIYFAGHGSRVRNTLSRERDRLDESIIPADAATGARDIRDKELRDRFNRLVDSGVVLTAIFDSCHSGSIARGPLGPPSISGRMLPIDPRDIHDASQAPNPADRGALILSAAQDDEVAQEHYDAFNSAGGLFTIALTRALLVSEPGESAMNLFQRTFAYMRYTSKVQNPVIEGSAERRAQPLFGNAPTHEEQRLAVAVQSVQGDTVLIQQGIAVGLTEDTELVMVGQEKIRLRISRVTGIAGSKAQVIAGSAAAVSPGDLFVVDKWAAPAVPELRVSASITDTSATELVAWSARVREAVRSRGYQWVTDPVQTTPTHLVKYEDKAWWLLSPSGKRSSLGSAPSDKDVIAEIANESAPRPGVFVSLPVPKTLRAQIQLGPDTRNSSIVWVRADLADYELVGRSDGKGLAYGWVRPWKADAHGTLPQMSNWITINANTDEQAGARVTTPATRLARVNAWLNLEAPPPSPAHAFPYRLALKGSNQLLADGIAYEGQHFEAALVADRPPPKGTPGRFVYVFIIDSSGASQLVMPQTSAVENRFPRESDETPAALYTLPETGFTIGKPFGTDTYFLLTTLEQLPDPWVLEWGAATSRSSTSEKSAATTPLGNLLRRLGSETRGLKLEAVPENWTLQRISIRSRARR
jgi:hypothetical protein